MNDTQPTLAILREIQKDEEIIISRCWLPDDGVVVMEMRTRGDRRDQRVHYSHAAPIAALEAHGGEGLAKMFHILITQFHRYRRQVELSAARNPPTGPV